MLAARLFDVHRRDSLCRCVVVGEEVESRSLVAEKRELVLEVADQHLKWSVGRSGGVAVENLILWVGAARHRKHQVFPIVRGCDAEVPIGMIGASANEFVVGLLGADLVK